MPQKQPSVTNKIPEMVKGTPSIMDNAEKYTFQELKRRNQLACVQQEALRKFRVDGHKWTDRDIHAMGEQLRNLLVVTNSTVSLTDEDAARDILFSMHILAALTVDVGTDGDSGGCFVAGHLMHRIVVMVQKDAFDLFCRKNHDYGDSFADHGSIGVIIRMTDKLNRLKKLQSCDALVDSESTNDTLLDLHNYAAMAIMLLDEAKE